MIRVILFLLVLAGMAVGAYWLAAHPGVVIINWRGQERQFSVLTGVIALVAAAIAVIIVWSLLFALFLAPKRIARASRRRRREKGLDALSRGVVAVGAGHTGDAARHARDAERFVPDEPLTQLLKAQSAQLSGNRAAAEATFAQMLRNPDTRALGLRGLHVEARRRGDTDAAHQYAVEAQKIAALPWAGAATLHHHASGQDWASALAAVERNATSKIIDKPTANRQRAVLKTALAMDKADREPAAALALARDAHRLAPDLIPAALIAGRLSARQGDITRAMRILEGGWRRCAHPDLARAYISVRAGDSARDRLARAMHLGQLALEDPEGTITVGRAALEARDVDLARKVMTPLFAPNAPFGRPSSRACLLMADIEEVSGAPGKVREWLSRASVAARDRAWIADGVIADDWAPVSPTTGRLDAFVWQTPPEHVTSLPPPPITMPLDHVDAEDPSDPPLLSAPAVSPEPAGRRSPATNLDGATAPQPSPGAPFDTMAPAQPPPAVQLADHSPKSDETPKGRSKSAI